jgi:NADH-quinone oxidoreductase subunit B
MGLIDDRFDKNIFVTSLDFVFNWARRSSLWWLQFGLACCAIELISASMSRFDLAERFGMLYRASPRQADLMIVAGTVTKKMAPVVRTLYDQMPEPKWVLAMGVCASSGGMFNNYAVVQGVDHVVPVDMYLPGCPPRPEMLIDAILKLHDQVRTRPLGPNMRKQIEQRENDALKALPTSEMKGLLR